MATKKIIYLIREDLRISDNAALFNAAKDGQILIVYIQDTNKAKPRGEAYNWWTYNSLISLNQVFQNKYNCNIHFYRGIAADILTKLCAENQIDQIYLNSAYDSDSIMLEKKIESISKKFHSTPHF